MKYSFAIPGRGPLSQPEAMRAVARHAEQLGYDMIMAPDHLVVPRSIESTYPYSEHGDFPGHAAGQAMEQLTVLSYLAGHTQRIKVGTSIMVLPHRSPIFAAKALATLDTLSGGRLVVGVGAGWMREEFEALGLPPFDQRGDVADEYIRAFKELWTSDNPTFDGKYCRFSNISFLPKPVQKPHPPLWVGGESPRAIRRAAELGDAWYPIAANPRFPLSSFDKLQASMKRLDFQVQKAGRKPGEVQVVYRTHQYQLAGARGPSGNNERPVFSGTVDQVASDIRRLEEMGVHHMTVDLARISMGLDDMLRNMEEMASRVWPKV